jgi:RNase P/RNase MRP subunit POP5
MQVTNKRPEWFNSREARCLFQTDYPTPPREPTTFRELFFSVLLIFHKLIAGHSLVNYSQEDASDRQEAIVNCSRASLVNYSQEDASDRQEAIVNCSREALVNYYWGLRTTNIGAWVVY